MKVGVSFLKYILPMNHIIYVPTCNALCIEFRALFSHKCMKK